MKREFIIKTGQGVVRFSVFLNATGLYSSCEPEIFSPVYLPYAGHLEKLTEEGRAVVLDALEAGLRRQYEVKP